MYSINSISLNQDNTRFCCCHPNGLKVFNIEPLKLLYTSTDVKTLSSVNFLTANLFYTTGIIVFVGIDKHSSYGYNEKKLVLYDLEKETEIDLQVFKCKIMKIKLINKLVFVSTSEKLCLFNIVIGNKDKKSMKLQFIDEIILSKDCNSTGHFESWHETVDKETIHFCVEKNNSGIIDFYVLKLESKDKYKVSLAEKDIKSGYDCLQGIISSKNYLFFIQGFGSYIKCFDLQSHKTLLQLYRGKKSATISSVIELDPNHLALSSSNGTLHIYNTNHEELVKKSKANSSTGLFSSLYTSLFGDYLKSTIKVVELKTMLSNLGNVICKGINDNEIVCISYSGNIFLFKINFKDNSYSDEKKNVTWYTMEENLEDVSVSIYGHVITRDESGKVVAISSDTSLNNDNQGHSSLNAEVKREKDTNNANDMEITENKKPVSSLNESKIFDVEDSEANIVKEADKQKKGEQRTKEKNKTEWTLFK